MLVVLALVAAVVAVSDAGSGGSLSSRFWRCYLLVAVSDAGSGGWAMSPDARGAGAPGGGLDAERRAALVGAKLAALVRGPVGPGPRVGGAVGAFATLVERNGTARGWLLAAGSEARALGPALAWADRQRVDELHLLADRSDASGTGAGPAGTMSRQARYFAAAPAVWVVDGTALAAAEPAPLPTVSPAPAPTELVDLLIDAGLEIVVEGGMVRGEVDGLEVARIVHGRTTAGEPIEAPRLEVGVGKADREMTAMVHSGLPAVDQLARVVEIVRGHRRAGAPRHPLNQLVPDRWLRAVLCRSPALVGLRSLRPAEGARPRANLADRDVAIASGERPDGSPVTVACAVGVALDLVPTAADARAVLDAARHPSPPRDPAGLTDTPGSSATGSSDASGSSDATGSSDASGSSDAGPVSELVLVVPERDDHPVVRQIAARLVVPATIVSVPGDWRAIG